MKQFTRRELLRQTLPALAGGWTLSSLARGEVGPQGRKKLQIAPFRFDVTPPMGHPCCGGWITPVNAVDDPLEALGFVLTGAGSPIVICAVDWTGILNEAHVAWRTALAAAAGTSPDRVAVHCVHQHNAPFACLEAERIVGQQGDLPHVVDLEFHKRCLDAARRAVQRALPKARTVTHVAHGQAEVEKVASNRRVCRDADGHIKAMRGSSCRNAELRALPEGTIDPWLKTVAFYDQDQKIVACHYYATHPMSYYGDGRVSSDFAGLARKQRQQEEPGCLHMYFTGCAGNIAAGKYNDGSKEMRPILTQRMYEGIVQSERDLQPVPVSQVSWNSIEILPPPRDSLAVDPLESAISNRSGSVVSRSRPSFKLSWLRRIERGIPIVLSALRLGEVHLLHLPSESFIEYQLRAQEIVPTQFVATAAYGDGGPWYIPVKEEYPHGGYEVSVAFADPAIDGLLTDGMKQLLS